MVSMNLLHKTVCVVRPGYAGLPLAEDYFYYVRTGVRANPSQNFR